MLNITERINCYTVRITRKGRLYTKSFKFKLNKKSKIDAFFAAKIWRDSKLKEIGILRVDITGEATANNQSTFIRGISEYHTTDKRCGETYGSFSVSYRENNRSKTKQFKYGNVLRFDITLRLLAFETAIACRNDYQMCVKNNTEFKPSKYNNWR